MRRLMSWLVGIAALIGPCGVATAGIEYHFMPDLAGQSLGCAQFTQIVPVVGPLDFPVLLSGSVVGCAPSLDDTSARAYLDKWGLGVLNPQVGLDTGVVGQVQLDGRNGGEYLRLEFSAPVRLTYLTFASVGLTDKFELLADGDPVDLLAMFPGTSTIRAISNVQGLWPGKVDFTRGAVPLPFATVWDVAVAGPVLGDGIQLENVGVDLLPEPSSLVLWLVAVVAGAAVMKRRRIWRQ
jgi:hypothetical protein